MNSKHGAEVRLYKIWMIDELIPHRRDHAQRSCLVTNVRPSGELNKLRVSVSAYRDTAFRTLVVSHFRNITKRVGAMNARML